MSDERRIALVAGETSGDQLGAALIRALRARHPGTRFFGIGGRHMRAEGMECWWDTEDLSVMGLFEVLNHLPRLLRLRRELRDRLLAASPDVLIGVDAPDFNLGLEKEVRRGGVPTVHYVSPTVWAWRPGRAASVGHSADMVLCLFPFEPDYYRAHGVRAVYTGHPLADAIPMHMERNAARERLGLESNRPTVALLPGSRGSEAARLAAPMLDAAMDLRARHPAITFIAPMAGARATAVFEAELGARSGLSCTVLQGHALDAMAAADVVVCASGTAALECMLVNRPMVVVYRLSRLTYLTARALRLVKTRFISMPNVLAGELLVPELLQRQASGPRIAAEVGRWLEDPARVRELTERFNGFHAELKRGAAASAARAIDVMLDRPR